MNDIICPFCNHRMTVSYFNIVKGLAGNKCQCENCQKNLYERDFDKYRTPDETPVEEYINTEKVVRFRVGWRVDDCYMEGIGSSESIGNIGMIEAIGLDWVIVRDQYLDKPILVLEDNFCILDRCVS